MNMKRIRIKKDLSVTWTILTNGEATALDKTRLSLIMVTPDKVRESITDFTVTDNVLSFAIGHDLQTCLGTYRLELWQDLDKDTQTAVDKLSAFQLVPFTTLEDGSDDSNITTDESADLGTSSMEVGLNGGSATITVIDNLTSTSATDALSANQGRVLNALIDTKADGDAIKEYVDWKDTQIVTEFSEALAAKQDKLSQYSESGTNAKVGNNLAMLYVDAETARLDFGSKTNIVEVSKDGVTIKGTTALNGKTIATTDQIPDTSNLLDKDTASSTYATKAALETTNGQVDEIALKVDGKEDALTYYQEDTTNVNAMITTSGCILNVGASSIGCEVSGGTALTIDERYVKLVGEGTLNDKAIATTDQLAYTKIQTPTATITEDDYKVNTYVAVSDALTITKIDALPVEVVLFVGVDSTGKAYSVTLPTGTMVMGEVDGSKPYCISIFNGYAVVGNFDTYSAS